MMPVAKVAVPETPGKPLVLPALGDWEDAAYANQAQSFGWQFDVAGMPYAALAGSLRRKMAALARQYTRELYVEGGALADGPADGGSVDGGFVDAGLPIVATGHQPGFWHPGIWFKNALVHSCASRRRVAGLNVVVDSDALSSVTVDVPVRDGDLRRTRDLLSAFGREVPFELMPVPDASALSEWLSRVEERLGTLRNVGVADSAASFARAALAAARDGQKRGWSFADFATAARRRFERAWGGAAYHELPLKAVCALPEFGRFFLDIVERREQFLVCHNAALAEYRRRRGLRGRAEPFLDLEAGPGEWELPFWYLDAAERSRQPIRVIRPEAADGAGWLSVTAGGAGGGGGAGRVVLRLRDDRSPSGREENLHRLAEAAGRSIRPKAVTLTMFLRIFAADLFVHGVGGARYDVVTDDIARSFFGIEPPRYAVASTTWWLPEPVPEGDEAWVRRLAHSLRDLVYNPDRHLSCGDGRGDDAGERELLELAREKQVLVKAINATTEREKKRATADAIREVNGRLAALLATERERARLELAEAARRAAQTRTARYRGYPFFLFDPRDILSEAEAMWTKVPATPPWC